MSNKPRITSIVLLAVIVGLAGYDLLAYHLWGNAATLSWVVLGIDADWPLFGFLFDYSLSVLIAHLFLPTKSPSPVLRVEHGRIAGVLAPVFAALVMIGIKPEGSTAAFSWLADNRWWAAVSLNLVSLLGLCVGMLAVPQHIDG